LDFTGPERTASWVLCVEFLDAFGESLGMMGVNKGDGEWKSYELNPGEQICGAYGVVSAKSNLVAFGFIVWTAPE